MSEAALALSLFLHIAATVIWIGGILLITFLVVPELQRRGLVHEDYAGPTLRENLGLGNAL